MGLNRRRTQNDYFGIIAVELMQKRNAIWRIWRNGDGKSEFAFLSIIFSIGNNSFACKLHGFLKIFHFQLCGVKTPEILRLQVSSGYLHRMAGSALQCGSRRRANLPFQHFSACI